MKRSARAARQMRLCGILGTFLLFSSVCAAQTEQRDTREPSKDADDLLTRFLSELVTVTPGEGIFPASTSGPSGELRPSQPFQISRYETTQELYLAVTGSNPSRWKGPRNSVETVSRLDVERFCERLTATLRKRGELDASAVVRLPTDVEWEYCCRAGSEHPYCFGTLEELPGQLDRYAWHTGNAAGNDPAVGVLEPNAFGLYDVHGYLWEFVVTSDGNDDPRRPISWAMGGSWRDPAALLKADSRLPVPDYAAGDAIGFRCVVSRPPEP